MAAEATPGPSSPTPEYLAEDCSAQLIATIIAFLTLECALFSGRLYCRLKGKVPSGRDDLLIFLALLANVAQNVFMMVTVGWAGVGRHLIKWVLTDPAKVIHEFQGFLVIEWTYSLAVCLPKLAILELYTRIFSAKLFRIICYSTMLIVIITFLAVGLTATFQCKPIAAAWDRTIPGAICINEEAFFRWASFPNIMTDIIIILLPIPEVLKLSLSRQKKIELLVVFFCGGAGIIFSIARFVLFFRTDAFDDATWESSILMIVTSVEPGMYFICACLPGVRPLIVKFGDRIRRLLVSVPDDVRAGSQTILNEECSQKSDPKTAMKNPGETVGAQCPTRNDHYDAYLDQDAAYSDRGGHIMVTTDIESTWRHQSLS